MYGKLINGDLRSSPKKITHKGHLIYNPGEGVLKAEGYLPIKRVSMPTDAPSGQHYESSWTQTETEILQVWTLVEDIIYEPEPTLEERMDMVEDAVEDLILTTML